MSGPDDESASAPWRCTGLSGKSTGSPSTFSTRPSVAGPTGTEIGAPVSITSMPRCKPSVGFIATVRTRPSPRCCSTSATMSIFSPVGSVADDADRVVDGGQVAALVLDVDDGSDDLDDLADFLSVLLLPYRSVRLSLGRYKPNCQPALPKPLR